MCSHGKIVLYLLFILYCTTLEVRIFMNSFCIILLLQHKYSAPLHHRHNWCQLPLLISRRPSISNGGAPVLDPIVAFPFLRVLPSVHPTPVPPTPHPVHPSHPYYPGSNQPAHRHPSRANGGAPVPAGANVRTSQPPTTNTPSSPPVSSRQ